VLSMLNLWQCALVRPFQRVSERQHVEPASLAHPDHVPLAKAVTRRPGRKRLACSLSLCGNDVNGRIRDGNGR
jgi:hypothetical protein